MTNQERIAPYKRIRLMALWFLFQTIAILVVMSVILGTNLLYFTLLGMAVGAATALSTCVFWRLWREEFEKQGFRW